MFKNISSLKIVIIIFLIVVLNKLQSSDIYYYNYISLEVYLTFAIYLVLIIIFFLKRGKFKLSNINLLLVPLLLSYISTLIIMIPINFYIIKSINLSLYEKKEVKFNGISNRRMSQGFYFLYNEKNYFVRGYREEFKEIEKNTINDYRVNILIRNGLFNSFILEDFEIQFVSSPD